jgi:UDP-glucose 4-epimerase
MKNAGNKRILVTGGCGYIGSHTIVELIAEGYEVVSADNGINSSFDVLDGIEKITGVRVLNIDVDLSDTDRSLELIQLHGPFDGLIHFAALKRVEESVHQPLRYFRNNVGSTLTTMVLIEELKIPHLIFSSSCTVYGSPAHLPVNEETPMGHAENPYGATKQTGEILYDQFFRYKEKVSGISLRYFNPGGAHPSALIGEASLVPSTNLIPVITETVIGRRKEMIVHGDDYPTRDGSCIRDYIHVTDLAKAHTMALEYLLQGRNESPYEVFNLGIGKGVTVLEAIYAFESATGKKVNYRIGPKRAGDVPAIYADNTLITSRIGWTPELNIDDIMKTAWAWEQAYHHLE